MPLTRNQSVIATANDRVIGANLCHLRYKDSAQEERANEQSEGANRGGECVHLTRQGVLSRPVCKRGVCREGGNAKEEHTREHDQPRRPRPPTGRQ